MSIIIPILIVLLGGAMEGSFALPIKYTPKWKWENIWGAGSLFALLLVPLPAAMWSVPDLAGVYHDASWGALITTFLFGCGWGAGGVFFGLGVSALGLSLGLSVIMALNAVAGSIIPLVMKHPEQAFQPSGLVLMGGVAVMILGVALCGRAAKLKDSGGARPGAVPLRTGLVICVLAALLSALVNLGLIYGDEIREIAMSQGVESSRAVNAVWAPAFLGNYLVNIGYCVYLMFRNRSLQCFRAAGTGRYWLLAVLMGVIWAGGIIVYGIGASRLGTLGAFLGFPVMLIGSILAGNVLGVASGEWNGVNRKAKQVMAAGVAFLIIAVFVLAYSNQLV